MKRFLLFPLGIALVFVQWRAVSLAEFLLAIWPDYSARNPRESFIETYLFILFSFDEPKSLLTQAVLAGVIGGLFWATFDYFRSRQNDGNSIRFLINLSWCWLYSTLFIALNGAMIFGVTSYYSQNNQRAPAALAFVAVVLCMGANGIASALAIGATISTTHILSPRSVLSALRKTTRLH